ncbi:MAG: hypothetical protein IJV67_06195 [Clostridia bacterium]|nr:hypothetical protein [Clostridia bacterium]MBQ9710194.1 hypothetical protein [Clostridia bacterium]
MKRNKQHPHLAAYRDLTKEIDAEVKKVDFLLGYQKTYFGVQRDLKSVLFRLTNERFLARIKEENDEKALREVERAAPYKDTITTLIENIDAFEAENKKLLEAMIASGKMDGAEFEAIYPYLYTLATDNTSHDRIPPELVLFFGENTKEKCGTLGAEDYAVFCYLLIKIKAKSRYSFAYPHLAKELVSFADENVSAPYNARESFYITAAEYYFIARMRSKAMECYKKAAEIAAGNGDLKAAANAMKKYYKINGVFPKNMQVKADEPEIRKEYGEYAETVLEGVREKGFKVDPVEFTEAFEEKYREVMWKVEADIEKEGDFRTGHQRWNLIEKYLAEEGIKWKSPALMNPGYIFD